MSKLEPKKHKKRKKRKKRSTQTSSKVKKEKEQSSRPLKTAPRIEAPSSYQEFFNRLSSQPPATEPPIEPQAPPQLDNIEAPAEIEPTEVTSKTQDRRPSAAEPKADDETIFIEMTPQLYFARKEHELKKTNAMVRQHVRTYFEWVKSIKPQDVVDAIELGTTAEQAYHNLGANPMRLGIAAARGFLKVMARYRRELLKIATLDLALLTLKFENPETYRVVMGYGERGIQFLDHWRIDAFKILGIIPKEQEQK